MYNSTHCDKHTCAILTVNLNSTSFSFVCFTFYISHFNSIGIFCFVKSHVRIHYSVKQVNATKAHLFSLCFVHRKIANEKRGKKKLIEKI